MLVRMTGTAGAEVCTDWPPKGIEAGLARPTGVPAAVTKFAVTACAALIATWQVPLVQPAPLQPVKTEPAVAAAVNVTVEPMAKFAAHVAPQLIPAGLEVTVPAPAPALVTVSSALE